MLFALHGEQRWGNCYHGSITIKFFIHQKTSVVMQDQPVPQHTVRHPASAAELVVELACRLLATTGQFPSQSDNPRSTLPLPQRCDQGLVATAALNPVQACSPTGDDLHGKETDLISPLPPDMQRNSSPSTAAAVILATEVARRYKGSKGSKKVQESPSYHSLLLAAIFFGCSWLMQPACTVAAQQPCMSRLSLR